MSYVIGSSLYGCFGYSTGAQVIQLVSSTCTAFSNGICEYTE